MSGEFSVTPWEVRGEVDYEKLIKMFGVKKIDDNLKNLVKTVLGEVPLYIRRDIFYSHRDLDIIFSEYLKGDKFYLYTGRGPSGPMHLGHIIPFLFTKYLQDKTGTILLIQITPDEKYVYHEEMEPQKIHEYAVDNIRDILSLGFNPEKTYLIDNFRHINYLYQIAVSIARKITYSTAKAVFGFTGQTNIGLVFYMAIQAAPAFLGYFIDDYKNCLIPAAIDQDPYWRVTRDIASKLGFSKPAQIHSKLLPGLKAGGKMSTSEPESALYLSDSPEDIRRKINNAFTGGQPTAELQRIKGGNPDICTVFSYYFYLFESDDSKLKKRYSDCRSGNLLCGECKSELIRRVTAFIVKHQREKRKIDLNYMERFMIDNKLDLDKDIITYKLLR